MDAGQVTSRYHARPSSYHRASAPRQWNQYFIFTTYILNLRDQGHPKPSLYTPSRPKVNPYPRLAYANV